MFDLTDRPLHWIPVRWPTLIASGEDDKAVSTPGEHEIELRVELLDRKEAIELFPAILGEDENAKAPDEIDVFKRVVRDWRKVKANGRAVPMNDENIALLLRAPMFGSAFTVAYVQALGGQVAVREKNSKGSPGDGLAGANDEATTTLPMTAKSGG